MKRKYIRINSVADIDTSRITLRDIENRYIDAQGRRYATRFNLRTRRIEIVPIALGLEEALMAKRLFSAANNTRHEQPIEEKTERRVHPQPMKLPSWLLAMNIEPDTSESDMQAFLVNAEREIQRNGERYRGLIQSLKASSILEHVKDSNQHDAILELTITYERDVQAHASRVQAMVVEFLRFPKPLASYLGQIDRKCKSYVENLDTSKQKRYCMAYLLSGEMFAMFKGSIELIQLVEKFTADARAELLSYDRKGAFESAMQTLQFLKDNIRSDIARFLGLLLAADVI
jgi:hypothetical protein